MLPSINLTILGYGPYSFVSQLETYWGLSVAGVDLEQLKAVVRFTIKIILVAQFANVAIFSLFINITAIKQIKSIVIAPVSPTKKWLMLPFVRGENITWSK